MVQALDNYQELNNQLRFLLFEIGIGLTPSDMDYFITLSHRDCLRRMHKANQMETITDKKLASHHIDDYYQQMKSIWQKREPASRFYPWQQLLNEMHESVANQSLAQAYRLQWDNSLKRRCHKNMSLWQWISEHHNRREQLEFFEQWGSQGHPYHPNFRAKIGLSRREVMQYSPEFQARVTIQWGALHRSIASTATMDDDYCQLLNHYYPSEMMMWREKLQLRHLSADDFYPIPIHPWQYQHKVQGLFAHLIDEGLFIPHLCKHSTKPSMSFRTMMTEQGLHLKLATAIHTTSAMRTVSPSSVHNGPALSHCLKALLTDNDHFNQSCYILYDLAGIHVGKNSINGDSKHLAAIVRQDPLDYLQTGETALPLATLFNHSPINQKPLLIEIIEQSRQTPHDYFQQYVRLVLHSQLTLYLQYGIGLEAHQQNTLVVFKNNLPNKLLIRDLGGIRIDTNYLQQSGYSVQLHPDSIINSESLDAVRDKFIHANLQSNLAYWVDCLHKHYGRDKQSLWSQVKDEMHYQLGQIQRHIPSAIYQREAKALMTQSWQHKCLFRMRLETNKDYILRPVPNPLADTIQ